LNFSHSRGQEKHNAFVKKSYVGFRDIKADNPNANLSKIFETKNIFQEKVVFL